MEQKKILWIIASVGVFLLVVMGAALIINRPAQGVEPSLASLQSNNDTWVMPPINEPPVHATDAFQTEGEFVDGVVTDNTVQDSTVGSMTTHSGNTNISGMTETTTIDLNSIKEGAQQSSVTATNQAGAAAVDSRSTIPAKAPASEATKPISGTSKSATTKSAASSSNKSQDQ